ncbi:MAG: hypothetical protein AUI47_07485 [Acidobacteria bacterium 13_1_40CM_2_68_5]|jgi:hypothetical protein|nr:MAG: hypothetical protein AUI47_07485 [Acidobacteria bacterium 13_1_40CM_2_68_5]
MDPRRVRLGDVIDDYCPRCRLIMNHGVVGMIGDEVKKVRCNTCLSEHQFRHGQLPASRKRAGNKLFEEVLKGIPGSTEPAAPPKPEPPPQSAHRRLYTIHRAIGGKASGKGPKKT